MTCKVCDDPNGRYGIVTSSGQWWGTIECPACYGSGLSDEEADGKESELELERLAAQQREKYALAMAEMMAEVEQ